jgi:hypothetical protein
MSIENMKTLFTPEAINEMFPENLSDQFFDALYGDSSEGAYDIDLKFKEQKDDLLFFEFHLIQRAGKCMRCSLTYGLPKVFSRHPIIDLKGLVQKIDAHLNGLGKCVDWKIGATREISDELHIIPLIIQLDEAV